VTDKPIVRPRFVLTFEPLPAVEDPIRALCSLLKQALRSHGLKCVDAYENFPNQQTKPPATKESKSWKTLNVTTSAAS
jgi:hypothetical protein